MSYATAAPGQQAGIVGSAPPTCQNCHTSTTPLWRRDESGSVLCNACGLFLKLHGRSRPSSLKTDVIKSRNRVKTPSQGKSLKRSPNQGQGLAAAHPELSSPQNASNISRHSLSHISDSNVDPEDAFINTDGHSVYSSPHHDLQHSSNIAPQHLFDGVTYDSAVPHHGENGFPSHTSFLSRPNDPLPSASPVNGHSNIARLNSSESGTGTDVHSLLGTNTSLKTRVSELEVINELFRGRVTELELNEAEAQRRLDEALRREQELRAKVVALEALLATASNNDDFTRSPKRQRMNGSHGESQPEIAENVTPAATTTNGQIVNGES